MMDDGRYRIYIFFSQSIDQSINRLIAFERSLPGREKRWDVHGSRQIIDEEGTSGGGDGEGGKRKRGRI